MRTSARSFLRLGLAAFFTVGIVALMALLAGRFQAKVPAGGPANGRRSDRPIGDGVEVVVKKVSVPRRESAVGTIRAVYEAIVASKVLARVEEVHVRAGQDVQQGEVLILLDKADLKARLEQSLAAQTAARAKLDQAEIDLARAQRLRARDAINQSDLDQATTAVKTAKADLDRTQRAVEEARIIEGYATITAPISGRVIDKKVNAGDTVTPGQPLLTMYDPTRMQLVATVRESLAMRLKVGQQLPARMDALGYDCLATISEIVPESQAESRSFLVKVTGPCPPDVYSGMFARIFIPLEDESVIVVPTEALRRVGQLDEVDVAEGGLARRRVVQLGRKLEDGREVLSGLKEGERVVLPRAQDKTGSDPS